MTRLHHSPRFVLSISGLALVAVIGSRLLFAGPLDPPAGPVMSTQKTLGDVEPRTPVSSLPGGGALPYEALIASSGSYYLTGDLNGHAGKNGILITATGSVSIDMNGFTIKGVPGSLSGILIDHHGAPCKVNILGPGMISNWGQHGINASSDALLGVDCKSFLVIGFNGVDGLHSRNALVTLDHLALVGNGDDGADINGNIIGGAIGAVCSINNGSVGLRKLTNGGEITGWTASGNTAGAIVAADDAVVRGSHLQGSATFGAGVLIEDCIWSAPAISGGEKCILRRNTLRVTTGSGLPPVLTLGGRATVEENVLSVDGASFTTTSAQLGGHWNTFRDNQISASGTGAIPALVLADGDENEIAGNLLVATPTVDAALVLRGRSNMIRDNAFRNIGAGRAGIKVETGGGNTLEHNRLSGDGSGAINAIRLLAGNNAVHRNDGSRLGPGAVFVDSQSAGNAVGPIVTAGDVGQAANPFANIQH